MAWIGPVIGAAASVIGSSMNSAATADTNAESIQVNRENRDWAEQMSNTAEQRHVSDLERAGLNPALAYQTTAPVPGMPNNPSLSPPQPGNGLLNSAQSISQIGNSAAQQDVNKATADNIRADTADKLARLPYSADSAAAKLQMDQYSAKEIWNKAANLEQDYASKATNLEMLNRDANFQQKFLELRQQIQQLDVSRAQLGLPRLENDASWQKAHPVLSGWLQSGTVDSSINAAGKIMSVIPRPFSSVSGRAGGLNFSEGYR